MTHFDEIWTPPWQQTRLSELVTETQGLKGEVIEIGVWQGLSLIPVANAVYPNIIHAVDHWKGSSDIPKELSNRNNFGQFIDNILDATIGNVCIHQQDWTEFAEEWVGRIRFLYLDAGHTTAEVENQITAFMNHMESGGILAGDDYGWPEVQRAVRNQFPIYEINVEKDKLWWVQF